MKIMALPFSYQRSKCWRGWGHYRGSIHLSCYSDFWRAVGGQLIMGNAPGACFQGYVGVSDRVQVRLHVRVRQYDT